MGLGGSSRQSLELREIHTTLQPHYVTGATYSVHVKDEKIPCPSHEGIGEK